MKPLFKKEGTFSVSRNGYRIYRLLFILWALIIILLVVRSFIHVREHGAFYLACDSDRSCANPFYNNCDSIERIAPQYAFICEEEVILPFVSYGEELPFYIKNLSFITIISFFSMLIFNHFLFNKGILKVDL